MLSRLGVLGRGMQDKRRTAGLRGAHVDVRWKRKQRQLERANDKKKCGVTMHGSEPRMGRQRGWVKRRNAAGRPKIAMPAQILVGSLPQLHKRPGHPEFRSDVGVKIPCDLPDRVQHVVASDFVLVIPIQSDPDETDKTSGGFGHKAHRAILEPSRDDICGARKLLNDIVRG